jgi:DNA-3-methyladenine glycosylase
MKTEKILPGDFYSRSPQTVAQQMLGKILCRRTGQGVISGYIVETESYGGEDDPASHAYKRPTDRNAVMFGPPGYFYIYLCYGMHFLLNISTREEGCPSAVLIRALEPLDGVDLMKEKRGLSGPAGLTSGPGRLTRALGIDRRFNGEPAFTGELTVIDSGTRPGGIVKRPRIGIRAGADKLLRYYIKDNPFVSKK